MHLLALICMITFHYFGGALPTRDNKRKEKKDKKKVGNIMEKLLSKKEEGNDD